MAVQNPNLRIANNLTLLSMALSFTQRLTNTLKKTRDKLDFSAFSNKKIDAQTLESLEELLLMSDVGLNTTEFIIESLRDQRSSDTQASIKSMLRSILIEALPVPAPSTAALEVLVVTGVNGAGKTTTIGKLAHLQHQRGKKVLIASADTFRAAAHEQLSSWAKRSHADIFIETNTQDPAAVAYSALQHAQKHHYDFLIVDTAGRQFNQKHLMDELQKVIRSIKKFGDALPHSTWLVIDAGSGQNGLKQAQAFSKYLDINGLVITKLEGSAKGGAILGICNELKIPLQYLGIGEQLEDLSPFNAEEFIDALIPDTDQ